MKKNKIVVTGGSGMIGRFLEEIIPDATYLSSKDYDLTNVNDVKLMYETLKPTHLIHLAAKVGGIIDNINKPAEYFDDNMLMNTLLVKYAKEYNVDRFLGILSSCIYPDIASSYPMDEDQLHEGPPTSTNFSYGYAKRCQAVQIDNYNKQYGTKFNYITPCNLYGEYDKRGENSHFVAALIQKIITTKKYGKREIQLFGTGKPLRQFMYGGDLAKIIKIIIDEDITESFNVATPENLSINEITNVALNATYSNNFLVGKDPSKPDGQFRKDVSIEKFQRLIPNFEFTNLHEGINKTFNKWMS